MATLVKIVFWGSLALAAYVGLIYPVLARLLGGAGSRPGRREREKPTKDRLPRVSIVVLSGDEETRAADCIESALASDYPAEKLEVIVGAEGKVSAHSLEALDNRRVHGVTSAGSQRRNRLLTECIEQARGDILVLVDPRSRLEPGTVARVAGRFHDPQVGAVCGSTVDGRGRDPAADEPRLLQRYRRFLRGAELQWGIIPNEAGVPCAFRKDLVPPVPDGAANAALFAAFAIHNREHRLVRDERATAQRRLSAEDDARPHSWPVRTVEKIRILWPLIRSARGPVSLAILFSRLLREFTPAFLVAAMMGNAILAGLPVYLHLLLLHELVYLGVLVWLCFAKLTHQRSPCRPPHHQTT